MADMKKPYLFLKDAEFADYVKLNIQKDWYFLKYFPLQYTRTFDFKTLEGQESLPVTAEIVAFDTPAPKKQRKSIGSWSGELSKIAISREKNERVITEMQNAEYLASKNNDRQAMASIVNDIFDDTDFVVRGINSKVEADALFIASHGFKDFDVKKDGKGANTKDRINFNIPSSHFGGVENDWSNSNTADGIGDILKIQEQADAENLDKMNYVFMSRKKLAQLLNQKATKERLSTDLMVLAGRSKYTTFTLEDINAYMQKLGYPIIEIIDRSVNSEQADGSSYIYKPFEDNVITLSPSLILGKTYYTTVPQVPNSASQQSYGSFYKVTRYGNVNPMLDVTLAEAYVQPALINRRNLFMLNTANTVWAEGDKKA